MSRHIRYDCNAIWHPIFTETVGFRIQETDWIKPCIAPATPDGWNAGHYVLNHFIQSRALYSQQRYLILCDDDRYEPGFFDKIDCVDGNVIICSMKRGDHQPPNSPPYGTGTLVAAKENMHVGGVAGEQMILSGSVFATVKFGPGNDSDGHVIKDLAKREDVKYVPEAYVWFNYLQPGRWNK